MKNYKESLDYILEKEYSITIKKEADEYYIFGWKNITLSESIDQSINKLSEYLTQRESATVNKSL